MSLSELRAVPAEQAEVAFLPLAGSELELVQPTNPDSGLARYLEKRGGGMHHVCLEVDDLPGMLLQLKSRGIRLINEEPRDELRRSPLRLCASRIQRRRACGALPVLRTAVCRHSAPIACFNKSNCSCGKNVASNQGTC